MASSRRQQSVTHAHVGIHTPVGETATQQGVDVTGPKSRAGWCVSLPQRLTSTGTVIFKPQLSMPFSKR